MQCLIKYYVLPNKSQHIKKVMCNITVYAIYMHIFDVYMQHICANILIQVLKDV